MEFEQRNYLEADEKVHCKDYINKRESYDSCDKAYINRILSELDVGHFTPIWATDDPLKVTTLFNSNQSTKLSKHYQHIVSGNQVSGSIAYRIHDDGC